MPAEGNKPDLFLLGSSGYSAQVAGLLGLPFAFASHFAPAMLEQALELYHARFRRPEAWGIQRVYRRPERGLPERDGIWAITKYEDVVRVGVDPDRNLQLRPGLDLVVERRGGIGRRKPAGDFAASSRKGVLHAVLEELLADVLDRRRDRARPRGR